MYVREFPLSLCSNLEQVRWEDQQKINEFGRLNSGLPELREEIAELKVSIRSLNIIQMLK